MLRLKQPQFNEAKATKTDKADMPAMKFFNPEDPPQTLPYSPAVEEILSI
jgi:hypothetical protein